MRRDDALKTILSSKVIAVIRMSDTKLYVDTWTGTMGATEVPATLISFALNAGPSSHLKQFAGSIHPTSYGVGRWEGDLTLTLEFNAASKAYVDGLLSGLVQRQIQIKATTGSGTTAWRSTRATWPRRSTATCSGPTRRSTRRPRSTVPDAGAFCGRWYSRSCAQP